MNLMKSILQFLNPKFWFMNYKYSAAWDGALNRLIDKGDIQRRTCYVHDLSGVLVWTGNYPYAYATPENF